MDPQSVSSVAESRDVSQQIGIYSHCIPKRRITLQVLRQRKYFPMQGRLYKTVFYWSGIRKWNQWWTCSNIRVLVSLKVPDRIRHWTTLSSTQHMKTESFIRTVKHSYYTNLLRFPHYDVAVPKQHLLCPVWEQRLLWGYGTSWACGSKISGAGPSSPC